MTAGTRRAGIAVAVGVALGAIYTLSPLTVLMIAAAVPVWRWASRDLSARERQWLLGVLVVAVALRLVAVAGLFLSADSSVPFANFFGDESFFKHRTLWLRNLGLGVPISSADFIYAFDETGQSSYLYVLAYVQALVGDAPYGVHLFNALLYTVAALGLYRIVRRSFGGAAAIGGLVFLLFLPSLFFWSISALKEPLYILAGVAELACVLWLVRAPRWWQRVLALVGLVAGAYLLQSLRFGGLALAGVGAAGGLALAFVVRRPRVMLAAVVVVPLAIAALLPRPAVQDRLWSVVHLGASQHWGHIHTAGYTYKLLEPFRYETRVAVDQLTPPEAVKFVVKAVVSYLTVPLPWHMESEAMLVYLPEQMVWYVAIALVPFGVLAGLRRDALLTSILVTHASVAMMMVALTGGNIGTLIRHRGLVLPYLVWLAALGACDVLRRLSMAPRQEPGASVAAPHGMTTA